MEVSCLEKITIRIDEIEKATGIDFFHLLPDEIEDEVEVTFDWNVWR